MSTRVYSSSGRSHTGIRKAIMMDVKFRLYALLGYVPRGKLVHVTKLPGPQENVHWVLWSNPLLNRSKFKTILIYTRGWE